MVKIMGIGMAVSTTKSAARAVKLTQDERDYLAYGLTQPGGKLPLFDVRGQEINPKVIKGCLSKGYAERWFANPVKPDWLVCRLTDAGRHAAN